MLPLLLLLPRLLLPVIETPCPYRSATALLINYLYSQTLHPNHHHHHLFPKAFLILILSREFLQYSHSHSPLLSNSKSLPNSINNRSREVQRKSSQKISPNIKLFIFALNKRENMKESKRTVLSFDSMRTQCEKEQKRTNLT